MASEEPEVLFEVDASKILAKLHLAGLQPCSYDQNKEFIVNTGIKNDNPKAKPDNPGKVEFDLENAQGEYEVGFVTTIGPYAMSIGIQSIIDQLRPKIAKLSNIEGSKEEEKSLLDRKAKKVKQQGDVQAIAKEFSDLLSSEENDKLLKSQGFDLAKHVEGLKKKSVAEFTKDELDALIHELDSVNKATDKNAGKLQANYQKLLQIAKDKAAKQLQTYMNVFVGPEKAKAVNADDMVMIDISPAVKASVDKQLVANYEIQPISDQEKEKIIADNQTHPDKCFQRVCFKIGYSVQIDK